MKKHVFHGWKGVFIVAILVLLGSAEQAFGATTDSQDVTLSATIRDPAGETGTFAFTFALEEIPATSAVMNNYSTLPPQPSAVPEPSTLALVGLGVLGLIILQKKLSER